MFPQFIAGSEFWGPLTAASIFVLLLLIAGVVNAVFKFVLSRWRRRAPQSLSIQLIQTLKGPVVLFIALAGLFLAMLTLTELTSPRYAVISGWAEWIRKAWQVVIIVEVTYLIYHILDVLTTWYIRHMAAQTDTQIDDRLIPPIRRVLPLIVYSIGTLLALSALNIPINPIWAGLGIGGIAVALAVQPTLSNFFAGTYVVTEGELNLGDFIELQGGPSGYVVEIGWRSTKIRSMFNNLVIIPNSRMAESIVTNYYSPTPAMNVLVYCGVSYDADLNHVEDVVREASQKLVNESPHAIKDVEPWFGFEEFGDSNITFWVFIQATDRIGTFTLTSDLVKVIHSRLKEEGIEINYPVRRLVFPPGNGQTPIVPPEARTN